MPLRVQAKSYSDSSAWMFVETTHLTECRFNIPRFTLHLLPSRHFPFPSSPILKLPTSLTLSQPSSPTRFPISSPLLSVPPFPLSPDRWAGQRCKLSRGVRPPTYLLTTLTLDNTTFDDNTVGNPTYLPDMYYKLPHIHPFKQNSLQSGGGKSHWQIGWGHGRIAPWIRLWNMSCGGVALIAGSVVQGQALARELFQMRRLQSVAGWSSVRVQGWEDILPRLPWQQLRSALWCLHQHLPRW